MHAQQLSSDSDLQRYEQWVASHPQGSLWQSLAWRSFQQALGREVRVYALQGKEQIHASALVSIDRTRGGLATWDIPRGPLWDENITNAALANFLQTILDAAKAERALSLTLSPKSSLPNTVTGFISSGRLIEPEATRIVVLSQTEERILSQMKPKGRYNIHLAEKHGVRIEQSTDIEAYAALAKQTGRRDKFTSHPAIHYRKFLNNLEGSFLLLAYAPSLQQPIAGLLGVIWQDQGLYYYGASADVHRHLMAPYLLQWHAMRHCKQAGCSHYDLFGIAPPHSRNHPWAGITDFKAKFGGDIVTYPPEQQIVFRPMAQRALGWKRKILG